MADPEVENKIKYILVQISKQKGGEEYLIEILNHSQFKFEEHWKNQLHSYIDSVLSGDKNKEFRKLAKSAIDFVENSCDLMSTTTHKLDAEKHLAEVCLISTISAISIISLIRHLE